MHWGKYRLDGDRVREHRLRRNWSQKTLANKAGVSVRWLINVEGNQDSVTPELATRLADALGIPLDQIVLKLEPDPQWARVPTNLRPGIHASVRDAIQLDMEGRHDGALTPH
jgi:transcriptional regulator with XRE-family HTH domain